MVKSYTVGSGSLALRSDIAAGKPIYIYFSKEKNILLYSINLVELLDSPEVIKPLKVSDKGISFLLQCGVVPPPNTVYQDVYIIGVGDKAEITDSNGKIKLSFSYNFPFKNEIRLKSDDYPVEYEKIQNLLLDATLKNLDSSKDSFLFHSAGKDSNPIAIAIAEAGLQENFTLVTHKTKRTEDESDLSEAIAKKLGFRHIKLNEIDVLDGSHKRSIGKLFENAPLPCTNNIAILYPLYVAQQPSLQNCNIIDGSGSDVYIGHVPGLSEYKRQRLSKFFSHFRLFGEKLPSDNRLRLLMRTRAEWTGLSGFSNSDCKKLFRTYIDTTPYWKNMDDYDDYLDFRASVRGRIIDTEVFMRKARNFSDAFSNNIIFPWADQKVAEYFMYMPENYLIDRVGMRNKLILRDLLKYKININSDEVGKRGFPYDLRNMVFNNHDYIIDMVRGCNLWNSERAHDFIDLISFKSRKSGREGLINTMLVYQLYMISGWYNNCRWLR